MVCVPFLHSNPPLKTKNNNKTQKTKQEYNTGDLSRNNWWVGILAFGEGWHNNHPAFEFSARHGLEKLQFDMTWMVIRALEVVGLATNVKLPTEKQKARLLIKKSGDGGGAAPAAA